MSSACNLEGGPECMQDMVMQWINKGTMLEGMECPATHPLN